MRRAISTSSSEGVPKLVPLRTCSCRAATTAGVTVAQDHGPPGADVVDELVAVDIPHEGALRALDEEGVRLPTALMARTGVLTPPGMYLSASSKRRADVSVFTRVLRASEKVSEGFALYYAPLYACA